MARIGALLGGAMARVWQPDCEEAVRVGVYLHDLHETSCGAYSIQATVLEALANNGLLHEVYIFSASAADSLGGRHVHVNIRDYEQEYRRLLARKRLSHLVRRVYPKKGHRARGNYASLLDYVLQKHGIHIVWFPTQYFELVDIPYIFTVWDIQHRRQPFFPEISMRGTWEWRERQYEKVIPRAAFVVTGTAVGKAEIRDFYRVPDERVRVIPLPVPLGCRFSGSASEDEEYLRQNGIEKPYLFYPGTFHPHKNHVVILLALSKLRREHGARFNVVFVGPDAGNRAYVERQAQEHELGDCVKILGFVPRDKLELLYRNAWCLAYMSFFGPDNLPPLESMTCGCPVVASDVPGAREQLGDAAILVDPKSEDQLAAAVLSLARETEHRDEMVRKGLALAQARSGARYLEETGKLLDEFAAIRRTWDYY